jgi:outer membrane murein-binding lipoprotein Lpp
MEDNNLPERESPQIEEPIRTELSEQPAPQQETQPMEIEEDEDIAEIEDTPSTAASEPLPDPLGEERSESLASEGAPDLQAGQPEEVQEDEATSPPEETETTPPTEASVPSSEPDEPKMISRSAALWLAAGGMVVSFILAVVFSLGILAIVNGGLRFARPAQMETVASQVNDLNAQTISIQREVDNLTTRINTLEGLDARVVTIEKDTQLLQDDVKSATTALSSLDSQVGELRVQVVAVESQIQELDNKTARFQRFLDGLRELLGILNQPQEPLNK